jgi:hypothetical protein
MEQNKMKKANCIQIGTMITIAGDYKKVPFFVRLFRTIFKKTRIKELQTYIVTEHCTVKHDEVSGIKVKQKRSNGKE